MPTQTTIRKRTVFMPCHRHAPMFAAVSRYRRAEVMVEGGWASSPCGGDETGHSARCWMKPGTDFYAADFVAGHPVFTLGEED